MLIILLFLITVFLMPIRIIKVGNERVISIQQEKHPHMSKKQIDRSRSSYFKTVYMQHRLLKTLRTISTVLLITTTLLIACALGIQFGLFFKLVPVNLTHLWFLSQSDSVRNSMLICASVAGTLAAIIWWYQYNQFLTLISQGNNKDDLLWTPSSILQRQRESYLFMLIMFMLIVYGFTILAVTNGIPSSVTPYYLPQFIF